VLGSLVLIAIYGGILRLARPGRDMKWARSAALAQSCNWFSEKIMLKQRDEIMIRFRLTKS
jgi:hypothetical protein